LTSQILRYDQLGESYQDLCGALGRTLSEELDVSDYLSPQAVRALCDAFVSRDESESNGKMSDRIPGHAAPMSGYRRPARNTAVERNSEPTFASLAVPFFNALVRYSPNDLGKAWLFHRLHDILVEHQAFKPGELEVLRADISARIGISGLAPEEKQKLTAGVDRILTSVTKRPLPGAHISRNAQSRTGH
jgi:hypothetical protein